MIIRQTCRPYIVLWLQPPQSWTIFKAWLSMYSQVMDHKSEIKELTGHHKRVINIVDKQTWFAHMGRK